MRLKGKTFDGVKLTDIVKGMEKMGVELRSGKRHNVIAKYKNTPFSCALGKTTGLKKHIMPWMRKAFPQYNNKELYQQFGLNYA